MKKVLHKYIYFLTLFLVLALSIWLFYLLAGFPRKQFVLIILAAIFYFIWGVVHHLIKGDFHLKIMLEYLLIAILAVILLKGAIFP